MSPLGRKKVRFPQNNVKCDPKFNGKHLGGWWETMIEPSKTTDKQIVEKSIRKEIDDMKNEMCEIVSIKDLSNDEIIRLKGYKNIITKVYNKWPLVEQYTFKKVINFEGKNILVEDVEKLLGV